MNKQSNTYTFLYSIVLVVIVAALLAVVALSLQDKQKANVENEKRQNILSAINVKATPEDANKLFGEYIKKQFILNYEGQVVEEGDAAFKVNIAAEYKTIQKIQKLMKEDADSAQIQGLKASLKLPVFEANVNGETKFILPFYGTGLWGPIWSYISINLDKNTVFGVFFDHKGETPGLGAEITNYDKFGHKFENKQIYNEDVRILKVKKGANAATEVDAISGGTITSKGVEAMLGNYFEYYKPFLKAEK